MIETDKLELPVGWEIFESLEPTYQIPDFELSIRCATKEIAEDYAKTILKNTVIVDRLSKKLVEYQNRDWPTEDNFTDLLKSIYFGETNK
jgi:hypothetical protein